LGFYLHEPPYLKKLQQLSEAIKIRISQLSGFSINQRVTFGGVILEVKKVLTKKSAAEMAFVKISDGVSEIETVVFPKTFAQTKQILNKEEVIVVTGKLDKREDELSVLIDTVEVFNPDEFFVLDTGEPSVPPLDYPPVMADYSPEPASAVEIKIPLNAGSDLLKQINSALKKYPGDRQVAILLPSNNTFKRLNLNFTIDPSSALLGVLEELLGPGSVRIG
jgi:hypothetical protein